MKKTITIAGLCTMLVFGVGCAQKTNNTNQEAQESDSNTVVNESTNALQNTNQNTNTATEEVIDTSDWQTYTNEEYGFSLKYPENWVFEESGNTVSFGTAESKKGGYIWAVVLYKPNELENKIAEIGSQFSDRKEQREKVILLNNKESLLVTITSDKNPEWISKVIYVENDGKLYSIHGSSFYIEQFERFYSSFEFN